MSDLATTDLASTPFTNGRPCVLSDWSDNGQGYGKKLIGGRQGVWVYAHRRAYERANGVTLSGLHVHHLCGTKRCVEPAHLIAVSNADHRRIHPTGRKKQTHCKRGHEFTPDNIRMETDGRRRCLTCYRARHASCSKKYRDERKVKQR